MCQRKVRTFGKARQTQKSRDWERYLSLKRATQKTCREVYNNYLIKTLTSDSNGNERLGSLIRSKQHDHLGVAPLKEGNIIYCDPIQRANILNGQFISVFTNDTNTILPDLGPSKVAGPDDIPLMLLK